MACPTCDHTMQNIDDAVYWCPRCGTVRTIRGAGIKEVPKLVERVVEFCGTLTDEDQRIINNLERLGVSESVIHPDVRL